MLYRFVLPRYFQGIAGGAETLCGELAQRLAARGEEVEILATCARDNRSWENDFEPGVETCGLVRVRRFPVSPRNLDVWIPLQLRLNDGMQLSIQEELLWMEHSVLSRELLAFLAAETRSDELRFFAPYLFGTTFWGALLQPEKSILIPCLHDEEYARLSLMRVLFSRVRGLLFNAHAESELAHRLYSALPSAAVVGMGFDEPASIKEHEVTDSLRESTSHSPFLLYLGRKETGKNVAELIEGFLAYRTIFPGSTLRLFVCGGGSFSDLGFGDVPPDEAIVDIAHVSEMDKQFLLREALALVQPSRNESFSIVLMEAWLQGSPVLVDGRCDVTREHVKQSGGGLYVSSCEDYVRVINRLVEDTALARSLGMHGRSYVRTQYAWEVVLDRFFTAIELFGEGKQQEQSR